MSQEWSHQVRKIRISSRCGKKDKRYHVSEMPFDENEAERMKNEGIKKDGLY